MTDARGGGCEGADRDTSGGCHEFELGVIETDAQGFTQFLEFLEERDEVLGNGGEAGVIEEAHGGGQGAFSVITRGGEAAMGCTLLKEKVQGLEEGQQG